MRLLVLLLSLAMPAVAWFAQREAFGPTNGAISDEYPTLLVAAGYAFAVWGVIFLLDVAFGVWQALPKRAGNTTLARIRPAAAAGFLLTAAWMPVFSQRWFLLSLVVIFGALAALAYCAVVLSRDPSPARGQDGFAWAALSIHAGWLSLAAFLNLAQVLLAFGWVERDAQLPGSLILWALSAVLLLLLNRRMRGNAAYLAIALWGLAAVYSKQVGSPLPGAYVSAWVAIGLGVVLVLQTIWLRARRLAFAAPFNPGD